MELSPQKAVHWNSNISEESEYSSIKQLLKFTKSLEQDKSNKEQRQKQLQRVFKKLNKKLLNKRFIEWKNTQKKVQWIDSEQYHYMIRQIKQFNEKQKNNDTKQKIFLIEKNQNLKVRCDHLQHKVIQHLKTINQIKLN